MAPIRRYLRITKYSVLEVRIYPEKPSDTPWLLSSRDPVLSRVIEEVRPKVLPKLREENENAKKKGGKKKKGIRDVASQEDFEVVIFLTDSSTRHSLITKQKQFANKPRLQSTGNKLTGWLNNSENPINVEDGDDARSAGILREDTDEVPVLDEIPDASTTTKRNVDEDGDALFVSSSDEEFFQTQRKLPATKRRKRSDKAALKESDDDENEDQLAEDDKKKLAINTAYDGFSIYGRVLCLIVKRKGKKATLSAASAPAGGSQMMENWVSTQAAQEVGLNEDQYG